MTLENMELLEHIDNAIKNSENFETDTKSEILQGNDWMTSIFGFTDDGVNSVFTGLSKPKQKYEIVKQILDQSVIYDEKLGSFETVKGHFIIGKFLSPTVDEIIKEVKNNVEKSYNNFVVDIVEGVDIGQAIVDSNDQEIFQVASQMNALEMINPNKTHLDGINNYINDNTQGPRASLAGAPGTFYRNYIYTTENGSQFNALSEYDISPLNGYFIWGTSPEIGNPIVRNNRKIRIPVMISTQVAGITKSGGLKLHIRNKFVSQIFSSSVPIGTYGNGGPPKQQEKLAKSILEAEYIGTIGLGILINSMLIENGKDPQPINLTLIGAGVFENDIDWVIDAIFTAIEEFSDYEFDLKIHGYSSSDANLLRHKFSHVSEEYEPTKEIVKKRSVVLPKPGITKDFGRSEKFMLPDPIKTKYNIKDLTSANFALKIGKDIYELRDYQKFVLDRFLNQSDEKFVYTREDKGKQVLYMELKYLGDGRVKFTNEFGEVKYFVIYE